MLTNDLKFKIALSLLPKIGNITAKKLIAYTGGVEAVFTEKKQALLKIPGIGDQLVKNITETQVLPRAEEEVEFVVKHSIMPYFYLDDDYPLRLKNCNDSPIILFFKGNSDLNKAKIISIVGTRSATDYGKNLTFDLIHEFYLRNHEVTIISGLAYGIDSYAHKAAIDNSIETIGVLAHGLDVIYPAANRKMAATMVKKGGLITEFLSKTKIDRNYFLRRNRVIAGMADATIVVESGKEGGALVTADIANSYNRDVLAFPGRIGDKYSEGCNFLIKTNRAALIESVDDIEYQLGWDTTKNKQTIQRELFMEFNPEEQQIVDSLKEGELPIDQVSSRSQLPVSKVSALLLNLEFNGVVRCLPGKIYKLL